ncbi:uncharacterized protein N0V89_006724 [Didymosphaeria variabile]|uniref:Uncharacterized protein n=1 Tax=Didymosphaeria variabile TaxID=1932322 RepID=A0A9W9C8T7_9PLEO|nr:uncharacterized protein N0V89_006724 [Didymosphaeria variabile]KAJ4351384.1 hypothetical protein N0V89_006724 [Didymosphaeria variabile]
MMTTGDNNLTILFDTIQEAGFCSVEEAPAFTDLDPEDEPKVLVTATNKAGITGYEQTERIVDTAVHGRQSNGALDFEDDTHAEDVAALEQAALKDENVSDRGTPNGKKVDVEDFATEHKPTTGTKLADRYMKSER